MIRIQVITLRQLITAIVVAILVLALAIFALTSFLKKDDANVFAPTYNGTAVSETQSVSASGQALAARTSERDSQSVGDDYLLKKLPSFVRLIFGFDPTDTASILCHALPGAQIAREASVEGFCADEHAASGEITPSIRVQIDELESALQLTRRSDLASALSLRGSEKRVFVYHSHTTEAYADSVCPAGNWRSSDDTQNVIRVGDELCHNLESFGIEAVHNATYHENPNYNYAYPESLKTLRAEYEAHPETALFIDLHRDAWIEGSTRARAADVGGVSCAQIQFVIGVGTDEVPIPHWKQNYEIAARLTQRLEELAPGITRPVRSVAAKYNQFVAPGCILVEIGHNQNTLAEAENSMKYLAEAIADLLS